MPFASDWLLWIVGSKNKANNKIIVDPDIWCVLGTTAPSIGKFFVKMQHQSPTDVVLLELNLINEFSIERVIVFHHFFINERLQMH